MHDDRSADMTQHVKVLLWTQVAEKLGVSTDTETLAWFLAIFDNLQALQSDEVTASFAAGLEKGAAMIERLYVHDFCRGIAFEHRRQCEARAEPVPPWVLAIEETWTRERQAVQAEMRQREYAAFLAQAETTTIN